jgi:hypothetical protein
MVVRETVERTLGILAAERGRKEAKMHLSWRDGLASVFVGAGAALYALWLTGTEVPGLSGTRVLAGVVLGLGLAASVTAVVYGVGAGLLGASKMYLAIASLIGLAALIAGVIAVVSVNETMLATLVASTVALWLMSTVRHAIAAETRTAASADAGLPRDTESDTTKAA